MLAAIALTVIQESDGEGALREFRRMDGRHRVVALDFSPDGRRLASAGDGVRMWDVSTGRQQWVVEDFSFEVGGIDFSPDGERLAVRTGWEVRILEATTGRAVREWRERRGAVTALAYSPDGTLVATGTEYGWITIWDATAGTVRSSQRAHDGRTRTVAFTPDGNRLVSSGERVRFWETASGREARPALPADGLVVLSPNGQVLVASGTLWDLSSDSELLKIVGHPTVAFSADGGTLVLGEGGR